jgi:hypothetical protein
MTDTYKNKFTPLQQELLDALESGKWRQSREYLRSGSGYCFLGVATKIADPTHPALKSNYQEGKSDGWGEEDLQTAPPDIQDAMIFRGEYGAIDTYLTRMNDEGASFAEIAAVIRKNPWLVFANFEQPASS